MQPKGHTIGIVSVIAGLAFTHAWAAQLTPPAFIPPYYENALKNDDVPLRLTSKGEIKGIQRAVYTGRDSAVTLTVEHMTCERASCDVLYEQRLKDHNVKLTSLGGRFRFVNNVEFGAQWKSKSSQHLAFVAKTPKAVVAWTRSAPAGRRLRDDDHVSNIRAAMNQQRFIEAMSLGNVQMGRWAPSMHQHARTLLASGRKDEAVAMLRQVVAWSPYSFNAQVDLAENTTNAEIARTSALAVWENAESPELTVRAARVLGRSEPDFAAIPVLQPYMRGLQIVLVPLPPCDARLIEEAGRVLSQTLDVPFIVARLPQEWAWGQPDRLFRQRDIQTLILQKTRKPIDFVEWTPEDYATRLVAAVAKDDAMTRFQVQSLVDDAATKPGQYRVERYLRKLNDALAPFRSNDRRTVYVGVTEADIFGGESNYLFSSSMQLGDVWATILSYSRMQAGVLGEPYEWRKRLIERVAKELVPASLKPLEISRPADPTDPYSYADSVERLNQKTLRLSAPTREALDRLRN
jgi:hypothetical protein